MVPDLIARLDRWLAANRSDYYANLQPGATAAQLDAFEDQFTLRLPVAFRLLYKWRNGQRPDYYKSLQLNWMFPPLEGIAGSKKLLDGMIGADFESPEWWRREWVPFLDNGGGDHLAIDLLGIDDGKPGQIVTFWHDEPRRPIKFSSLDAWLEDLVRSMEDGKLEIV